VLEATTLLAEVPTGVVADVYSRRLSIVIGVLLTGVGFMVEGLWPTFEAILLAQVIWGLGATFMSGATQAWISDEIGEPAAARAFLRGSQVTSFCTLLAIPVSVALAGFRLNVPILVGAALMLGVGLVLAATMPETGFQPRRSEPAISPLRSALATLRDGGRVARGSPLVLALLLLAAVFGMASEGFDRLWTPLVLQNFEFPSILGLDQIAWFGVMRGGAMLLAIGATEVVRRRLDLTDSRAVAVALLACDALRIAAVLVFAFAGEFVLALLAFWLTSVLRRVTQPILLAWLNQQLESSTRATVLSMGGQADALGQIVGGPVIGGIGNVSLRAAIALTGLSLAPALVLYARILRKQPR
jgi:MFS transporter, DHA3 family, tetracycline resistance protein